MPDLSLSDPSLHEKLDQISRDLAYLAERQRRVEEFITEMQPIAREVMGVATTRLADLETRGYFRFGDAALSVADRVVAQTDAAALDALVDNVGVLLETVRALTDPALLRIAVEAGDVVHRRDELEPLGVIGMVRAAGDPEVQRGLAVLMELTRHLGRAADTLHGRRAPAPPRAVAPVSGAPPRPAPGKANTPGTASSGRYARSKATAPAAVGGGAETEVGGVRWAADGSLADPAQWTPDIAEAIAAASGVSLTEEHQRLIRFAREEWTRTGQSPNIRRMTTGAQITTKEIYTLFPKAPGRTISRIAGIPKPAGCI